jgi:hypothetical protein
MCCGESPDERLAGGGVAVFALELSLLRVWILAGGMIVSRPQSRITRMAVSPWSGTCAH